MSAATAAELEHSSLPRPERCYTFAKALEYLPFPSEDALRKYLERRPGLVQIRHWRVGRSVKRFLSESEIGHLQEILSTTNSLGR